MVPITISTSSTAMPFSVFIGAPLAITLALVFAALAALHLYWAASTTMPSAVVPMRADGTLPFRPGRGATVAVALALVGAAVLVLGEGGVLPRVAPAALYRAGSWMLGAVLTLRVLGDRRYVGLFKRERHTRFATLDSRVYTPLCAALAAGVVTLVMRGRW